MYIINFILTAFIIGALRNILTRNVHSTILSCGIFGVSCREGKKPNVKNLIILGLYNRTRGTDSCGYYYNGNIVKGVDKEADFKDFIIKNKLQSGDLPYETVMCHTRKSTYGSHTEENAHPFQVGNYVQTHNGTIKNIWTLCGKYGVDHKAIHVDSLGLANIIEQHGFKVLNEYEGYAALTMVFMDDPASMYLYHGASREKEEGTLFEERPLFYMQTQEGLYYSSLEESLAVINPSPSKYKIETLPHNKVYRVEAGRLIESVFDVDRTEMNVKVVYSYNSNNTTGFRTNNSTSYSKTDYTNNSTYKKAMEASKAASLTKELPFKSDISSQNFNSLKKSEEPRGMILSETAPPEKSKAVDGRRVYYRYGRHHTWNLRQVDGSWCSDEVLLNGKYLIDRDGIILENAEDSNRTSDTYYFIRGILLKGYAEYLEVLSRYDTWKDLRYNLCVMLSKFSRYPITCYFDEGDIVTYQYRNRWFLNQKAFDGEITAKFTKRKYRIKTGYLETIVHETESPSALALGAPTDKTSVLHRSMDKIITEVAAEKTSKTSEPQGEFAAITEIIHNVADKVLVYEDLEKIPECFYLFIERYLQDASPAMDDEALFNSVVVYMEKLIETKTTLLEFLSSMFEEPGFVCEKTVETLFEGFTAQEIMEMPNRYTILPFKVLHGKKSKTKDMELSTKEVTPEGDIKEPTVEGSSANTRDSEITEAEALAAAEKERELKKKMGDILRDLTAVADDLQKIDTDSAQDAAFTAYKYLGDYEKLQQKKATN